jgi:hypothetical protein
MEAIEEKAKAAKRKSRVENIKSRVNSGAYNMSDYKKNRKNLYDKVKFFQNLEAKGPLKAHLVPRYDEAKVLLARVDALKSGDMPAAMPAAIPPAMPTLEKQPPTALPKKTIPKTRKKVNLSRVPSPGFVAEANFVMPKKFTLKKRQSKAKVEFNPPAASPIAALVPYGQYTPGGTFKTMGQVAPTVGEFNEAARFLEPTRSRATRRKASTGSSPEKIYNQTYINASREFLPLPELYDPFTGRKFSPDEDPLTDIERAYNTLEGLHNPFTGDKFKANENPTLKIRKAHVLLTGILKKAHRKAATMRSVIFKSKTPSPSPKFMPSPINYSRPKLNI